MMSHTGEPIRILGVVCFRDVDDPNTFSVVAEGPGPDRDADGRPVLKVIDTGKAAILQLATRFAVDDEQLERVRDALAARFELDRSLVRLGYLHLPVVRVVLLIGQDGQDFRELASARSSGYPPWRAIFSVSLEGEDRTRALAALEGRKGFVRVDYELERPIAFGTVVHSIDVGAWV